MNTALDPVVKQACVPLTAEEAFAAFTEEVAAWWPLATHSVGHEQAVDVAFDNGRLVETTADGARHVWGTVTEWAPPRRLAMTWHPGTPPEEATHVEVVFEPDGPDRTRVTLTHTGWENRPDSVEARGQYDPGWEYVLGRYLERSSTTG